MPNTVVFVCSGNICRSPMAEVIGGKLLAELLADSDLECAVESAGTLGIESHPAARNAQDAVLEIGLDLSDHESQGISFRILHHATAFVVMSPEHESALLHNAPDDEARIVRLWEFTDEPGRLDEIRDPVGQDSDAFRRCRDEIVECLQNWTRFFADQLRT